MYFKQVLALAIVTLGVAATAQADVVTNKPEYAYATEKAGTGTYNVFPIADIGNPDARKKYEQDKAREAVEKQHALRSDKSGK